jgi:thiol-disulfide isomerase/thioredoxin
MKTKWALSGLSALLAFTAGLVLYAGNAMPVVAAVSEAEARDPSRPFVVKMHAQWCPVCLLTKGTWAAVQQTHAGSANLVVFDFTNEKTTEASRADAKRLGLEKFFDENGGVSGVVYVLDGRTKEVRAELVGEHNAAAYRRAIEAAMPPSVSR